jgi:rare lipoprotein A (peptidoglycan hydrolase)
MDGFSMDAVRAWTWLVSACVLAVLAIILVAPALVSTTHEVVVPQLLPAPRQIFDPFSLYGVASWYGKPSHGRKTASGAIYDMGGYSVAHKSLPLGTFVIIQNLENDRWCVAVVNDRGPYIDGRDWDVSAAVAGRLGMTWKGIVPAKVRIIDGY